MVINKLHSISKIINSNIEQGEHYEEAEDYEIHTNLMQDYIHDVLKHYMKIPFFLISWLLAWL